jgi:hypothetical protein
LPREEFYSKPWNEVKNTAGRMYSRTPYRGWVLKVSPAGVLTPVAPGFRSPNGLGFDRQGRLFVSDNQGDWLATSKCFHVVPGNFHGHPASLVWTEGWDRDPLHVPVAELDAMRTKASFLFPQGEYANSPTQPICETTDGKFGPFGGQMLIGEMNVPRILRLLPDEVDGQLQGGVVFMVDGGGLRSGINRLAFAPDGSLFVGQTHLSWAGDAGVQRVRWTGKTPMEVESIQATGDGFRVRFTMPLAADVTLEGDAVRANRFTYHYHATYGSPKVDATDVPVHSVKVALDRRAAEIRLEPHRAGYIYELKFDGIRSAGGASMINRKLVYHMIHVPR